MPPLVRPSCTSVSWAGRNHFDGGLLGLRGGSVGPRMRQGRLPSWRYSALFCAPLTGACLMVLAAPAVSLLASSR